MDRKTLLSTVGLGSLAAASLATGLDTPARPVLAADTRAAENISFYVAALSLAGGKGARGITGLGGTGNLAPWLEAGVQGSGVFQNYDPTTPKPYTILHSGTWKATKLVSWTKVGNYGMNAAAVLTTEVTLVQHLPTPAVMSARLTVVCNIPQAPLMTGQPEGFMLDAPFGLFRQAMPAMGITLYLAVTA
jgi:hypothetical protein